MKVLKDGKDYSITLLNNLSSFDKDDVKSYVNNLILILKDYDINLSGFYSINIYTSKHANIILFNFIDDLCDAFDYKIKVYTDKIYFKFKDYFNVNNYDFFKDDYYFINVNKLDNIIKYIEFGEFVIKK